MEADATILQTLGKWLIVGGLGIAVIGGIVWAVARFGGGSLLPGDIVIKRPGFTFYFPLASCIAASIVLTLIFYLIRFIRH
ncbi:MAG: DUF2905 domain-containing protein [Armatimonadota bacterium]